jgi:hypothetical protein
VTKIAEAYFHIKQVKLTSARLEELGYLTSEIAFNTAKYIFSPETIIEVRLSDGSLKGWVGLTSSLTIALGMYGAIANYKGFKESISEIKSDAIWFGNIVSEKFVSESNLNGGYLYRKENRTKTPGKIKRLIDRRERLEKNRQSFSDSIIKSENIEIERMLQKILEDVDPSERASVRKLLGEDTPTLPLPEAPRLVLNPTREEQFQILRDSSKPALEPVPDYLHRFKLSDGPS